MDAENDNEQPNSSSASSSNNSSSSNLLVNLPMLPMLNSQDDEEVEESMPLPLNQQSATSAGQSQQPDSSVFISPLLFNNNSTPPPSSSSSSSSSSSHNLHLHHHIQHSDHLHHQHSPPPSLQQHDSLFPREQQQQSTIDDNAVADTIDASVIEASDDIDLNADVASTSQQQRSQSPGGATSATTGAAAQDAPHQTLPLLLQEEAKQSHSYASPFTHPYINIHHHHHNQSCNNCSDTFGFEGSKGNGTAMFSTNDNNGGQNTSNGSSSHHQPPVVDRLKILYPNVNEHETPLPRSWSPHDKCLSIGLSQNNLRVHYKGVGKQHNDAASVRTAYPIPPACGLYYFEVKIISKGKNGYMGIGLTAQQFRMNRLPGWDKQSYGYHGDDGNSFSSSGNGQSYGPTFTTGDVIGCCVNFVNNTCFYTKNGIDLGIAFRDLPSKLYPTVGLQTPGEEVDANFGQEPFKFDQIEDMMKQMRVEMKTAIYDSPMPVDQGDPTTLMHRTVSSYLVHNGYSQTADAFAKAIGHTFREDMSSIRNRQKILKLVMAGKMGQAIEHTLRSYPGLLETNRNLLFMLKCRQFVEMVNGSDVEYCPTNNKFLISTTTQTQTAPLNQTSVIQSTKSYQNGESTSTTNNAQNTTINSAVITTDNHEHQEDLKNSLTSANDPSVSENATNSKNIEIQMQTTNIDYTNDVEMENNAHTTNGSSYIKNGNTNNFNSSLEVDEEMADIDTSASEKQSNGIERILEFGKELSQMGQQLEKDNQMTDEDRKMLENAFSLIAYSNPWSSPLGWQLCPTKRENVCTALNSAILESLNYPRRPPLDICVSHAAELLKVMAHSSLGACAFVNIEDIFPQN